MPDFQCETYLPPKAAEVAVLRLSGNLDSYSLPELEKNIKKLVAEGRTKLVVNFHKLKFLSSPGMGLFLGTLGELDKKSGKIVFAEVMQPEVHDAMNLLGFFDVFRLYEQEAEAIQSLQS